MSTVASENPMTHLDQLLDRVAQGEELTITRHGAPVAQLVPMGSPRHEEVQEAIRRLRTFRRGRPHVTAEEISTMRHEGHCY